MQISNNQLEKLRELYFQHTGNEISREDAVIQGKQLIFLVKTVLDL